MKYIYETESKNYEDFSSGRVLYNKKGATSFPVRLSSEIFLRSKDYLNKRGVKGPFTIYDPCCGGGYLLTTLGFLHGEYLSKILASDINEDIIDLAKRNLSLLTLKGIDNRIKEIKGYIEEFNKDSHREALESAERLKAINLNRYNNLEVNCFKSDALNDVSLSEKVDLIISDIPYGNLVDWSSGEDDNIEVFLGNMLKVIKPTSILAIISDKKQVVKHNKYNRIKHFTIGKRRISFLEPL